MTLALPAALALSLGTQPSSAGQDAAREPPPPSSRRDPGLGGGSERARPTTPRVQIESPDASQFISGPTPIRATVQPETGITGVSFFVDGRQVCEFGAPPFACEWDAGR